MKKEEMEKAKKQFKWGTKEREEISLREMIESVWCYGFNCYNSDYIKDYFKNGRLSEKRVWEIVEEQLNYLENNCIIVKNVYTDNEGLTYNSIIEKNKEC